MPSVPFISSIRRPFSWSGGGSGGGGAVTYRLILPSQCVGEYTDAWSRRASEEGSSSCPCDGALGAAHRGPVRAHRGPVRAHRGPVRAHRGSGAGAARLELTVLQPGSG